MRSSASQQQSAIVKLITSLIQSNTRSPLVSVIMPAYNARPFIEDAIRSVLTQDYPHIEVLVVDDGSNDGTPEAAEQFGGRVTVLRQKNAGPAAARNRGILAASGEFIAFLDADDIWLPGKVTMQVKYLQDYSEAGVVFGRFLRWEAQLDGVFSEPPPPTNLNTSMTLVAGHSGWIYKALLFDNVVHIITAMIRRSVIDQVGTFDESLPTGEDYDFWLRVSRKFRMAKLDHMLAYYRMHGASITKVPHKENNEYKVLLKALATYGPVGPDGIAVSKSALRKRLFQLCFNHGYFHIRYGDPKVAQQAFLTALHHSQLKPKVWVYWMLAVLKKMRP